MAALACAMRSAGADQSPMAASSSLRQASASPTTGSDRCLWASKAAVLMLMKRTFSSWKQVHEPVVKSCSRVPSSSTTSASCASALPALEPVGPVRPMPCSWLSRTEVLPAVVSATGMPRRRGEVIEQAFSPAVQRAAPAMISGRWAVFRAAAAAAIWASSARWRGTCQTRVSKNTAGKSCACA